MTSVMNAPVQESMTNLVDLDWQAAKKVVYAWITRGDEVTATCFDGLAEYVITYFAPGVARPVDSNEKDRNLIEIRRALNTADTFGRIDPIKAKNPKTGRMMTVGYRPATKKPSPQGRKTTIQ